VSQGGVSWPLEDAEWDITLGINCAASMDEASGARWWRTGAGVLTGLGHAFGIGGSRTRMLDAGLDFAWQSRGSGTSEAERSFTSVFRSRFTSP
jgi:hypothetical protein